MSAFKAWLKSQLKIVEAIADDLAADPDPDFICYDDDLREIVRDAERQAAAAGILAAVAACQIRRGPITPAIARRCLAAAIAATSEPASDSLTVKQAASFLGVSTDKVYDLVRDGSIRHKRMGRVIRFQRADLEEYRRDSTKTPLKLRYL